MLKPHKSLRTSVVVLLASFALFALACSGGNGPAGAGGNITLQGAGATFPNPLYQKWVSEYGNPDVLEDRAFIAQYSAYQRVVPGMHYPEPYITTNTEDDRVHPTIVARGRAQVWPRDLHVARRYRS